MCVGLTSYYRFWFFFFAGYAIVRLGFRLLALFRDLFALFADIFESKGRVILLTFRFVLSIFPSLSALSIRCFVYLLAFDDYTLYSRSTPHFIYFP